MNQEQQKEVASLVNAFIETLKEKGLTNIYFCANNYKGLEGLKYEVFETGAGNLNSIASNILENYESGNPDSASCVLYTVLSSASKDFMKKSNKKLAGRIMDMNRKYNQ